METTKNPSRIHPLVAGAAVSVMLVSLIGVAAITGILPNSHSNPSPTSQVATVTPAGTNANPLIASATPASNQPAAIATTPKAAAIAHAAAPTHRHHSVQQNNEAQYEPVRTASAATCYDCGRVEAINVIQQKPKTNGVGAVAGAVLGGVLGNQFGGGNGRKIATVAGAVGGGFAGDEVERRTRDGATSYEVRVRMEDGEVRSFPSANQPGWNVGDRVRVVNGALSSRG